MMMDLFQQIRGIHLSPKVAAIYNHTYIILKYNLKKNGCFSCSISKEIKKGKNWG
jgi:hypothetical protein